MQERIEYKGNESETFSGFVALIGAPNAGKSTLLNQLVGCKLSIVTHKVQTTRSLVRGIVTQDNKQIIFVDTPGLFKPKGALERMMVNKANASSREADIVTMLMDAKLGLNEQNDFILQQIAQYDKPKILILNKIDLVRHEDLLALITQIDKNYKFDHIFMISALKGSHCQDYLQTIYKMLPKGPFYYAPDQVGDIALRELAAEITREKIYLRLHEELPYSCAVRTEKFEERKDGSVKIDQIIYVEREGQKKIVLGSKGSTIKIIGQAAREELSLLFDKKVHLFLFVKVHPNWQQQPEEYCDL